MFVYAHNAYIYIYIMHTYSQPATMHAHQRGESGHKVRNDHLTYTHNDTVERKKYERDADTAHKADSTQSSRVFHLILMTTMVA